MRRDGLERTTTALDELRAQRLVAAENAVKTRFQSLNVQRPIDTKRTQKIVNRPAGLQLFQKPQTLLGKRQKRRYVIGDMGDGRRIGFQRRLGAAQKFDECFFMLDDACAQSGAERAARCVDPQSLTVD